MIGRHIEIRGVVEGVGFRPWIHRLAHQEGVAGRVRNDSRGVVIEAFGTAEAVESFTVHLGQDAPLAAHVREIEWQAIPPEDVGSFTIEASEAATEGRGSIPPDLATCDACLEEVLDPANRRYRYAFTSCATCGPRYTIVRGVPYGRGNTTMDGFEMCDACRAEYDDPLGRRFQAQANACPDCGPELLAVTPHGREVSTADPVGFAARALRAQMIVAVKGLGGFHLACDATSATAVMRLRERRHRAAKPLAVMVRDLAHAEQFADLTNAERMLLTSPERPVTLVHRRRDGALAEDGDNPLVGLILPYTPLHHLLLREAGLPLVITSGNPRDEAMCAGNTEALRRLGSVADLFLMHDRQIGTRTDDSVVRMIAAVPVVLRRGRGYVPRGVELATVFAEPVLAVGTQLKNAICIGAGRSAFFGPHIGDLDSLETLGAFEDSIEQTRRFAGVSPRIVAHDLHPDCISTRWAARQPESVTRIPVQHHHAHIAAVMAEHGLTGEVAGVAYDGGGYGTDGTSWGGEILLASLTGFARFAAFRAIPLPGGDQAIRHVWRIALALVDEAFDGAPPLHRIPLFRDMERHAIDAIRRMIALDLDVPRTRGVGRYFDGLGALGLAMPDSRYQGEVASRWNMAADRDERGRYAVVVRDGASPWEVDLRSTVKAAVLDLISGLSPAIVSARFHNTIAEVTIELARAASGGGRLPIVLAGGCFANALLAERILRATNGLMNRAVPPGDGGLALGQAVIANALARRKSGKAMEAVACG